MSKQEGKANRKLTGRVISNKMNKSVTVLVERTVKHPIYQKFVRRTTKIHAHDEGNECGEGDVIVIQECRPISKTKAWRLTEILERANPIE